MEIDGFGALHLVGNGQIGTVYRAKRLTTDAYAAIKVLREWKEREAAWERAMPDLRAALDLRGGPVRI